MNNDPKNTLCAPPPPKYWRWADEFHRQIREGELKPGDRLPSIAEMKSLYGVSRPLVERMHDILERQNLIVREPGRGVFVAPARVAAEKSTGVLGVSIPGPLQDHPYYTTILRGIQNVCREQDAEILLTQDSSTIRWEKVDWMLLVTPNGAVQKLPPGMPAVSLLFELEGLPSVITDDYQAVKTLTQHLLQQGHRRIGFITVALRAAESRGGFPDAFRISETRLDGYRAALREWGITPDPAWTHAVAWCGSVGDKLTDDETSGRETMRVWLREGWSALGCSALLVQNDGTAIGVIEALRDAGIRVPQDLSVAGFDGITNSSYFRPRLTTMQVPLKEIGAQGAWLLLGRVRLPLNESGEVSQSAPNLFVLPATLKIGESSAAV